MRLKRPIQDSFPTIKQRKFPISHILHIENMSIRIRNSRYYYLNCDFIELKSPHSEALKLYTGLIVSTISTVSTMAALISSIDLYACGASSIVERLTEVV